MLNYAAHEKATEQFYATGIERVEDYHGTFLNFGMWDYYTYNYLQASHNLLHRVADKIQLNSNSILLDVACGMGASSQFYKQEYLCRQIDGFDLTAKHVEIAKKRNAYFPDVYYYQGDACQLNQFFGERTFSHVIGIEGPAHFNLRQDFMREAYQVLKLGGWLGMSDYCLAREPKNWWEQFILHRIASFWHIPLGNIYSSQIYASKLKEAGFTNVDVEIVTDSVIPGYLKEQKKPEVVKETYRIRGQIKGRCSSLLNWMVNVLYQKGLLDYVIVAAQKPEKLDGPQN